MKSATACRASQRATWKLPISIIQGLTDNDQKYHSLLFNSAKIHGMLNCSSLHSKIQNLPLAGLRLRATDSKTAKQSFLTAVVRVILYYLLFLDY